MIDLNKAFDLIPKAKRNGHAETSDANYDYVAIDHYDHLSIAIYVKGTSQRVDYFHIK